VREAWPLILDERNRIEPAQRRDLLIAAEARRLAASDSGPVIAAGSTGSMPATAALIEAIARLPHGAVVLPGLAISTRVWDIGGQRKGRECRAGDRPSAMRALLRRIRITAGFAASAAGRAWTNGGCLGIMRPWRDRQVARAL
jgi:ATP-dependent helicase/nuclease subunit B